MLRLRKMLKHLNTTLVSVRDIGFVVCSVNDQFKYNSCVGSSLFSQIIMVLVTDLNTTLVSVRVS